MLVDGEVVFRVSNSVAPNLVRMAQPTLDVWSFMVVLYRTVVHKPLLEADDRDNLRSKRELMILATWGGKALSQALADADAALVADGVDPIERLVVRDLLGWGLQPNPADRPQSFEEVLAHPFFSVKIFAAGQKTDRQFVEFAGDPAELVGKWIEVEQLDIGKVIEFKKSILPVYDSQHVVEFASGDET